MDSDYWQGPFSRNPSGAALQGKWPKPCFSWSPTTAAIAQVWTGVRRRHDAVGQPVACKKTVGTEQQRSPVTLFLRSPDEWLNLVKKKGVVPHGSPDKRRQQQRKGPCRYLA